MTILTALLCAFIITLPCIVFAMFMITLLYFLIKD